MRLPPAADTEIDLRDEFEDLRRTAEEVPVKQRTELWARLGFVGRGVLYLVVAAIALELAWGFGSGARGSGEEVSKEGAVHRIAEQPFGEALLVALAVALAGYALWRLGEALWGARDELRPRRRLGKRLLSGAKGLVHLALLASTVRVLLGDGAGSGGGSGREETWTARALALPGGPVLVGAAAAALLLVALWLVHRAFVTDDDRRLDTAGLGAVTGRLVDLVGMLGMLGRAAVVALLGSLLLQASLEHDPEEAAGLDEALRSLLDEAYGRWAVTAIAAGLACYGLYSWIEARYRRL